MRLAPFIAGRYLFAKKSHNVINIISAISAIGMAIGTAALIIILSVYNGFDSLIRSMMSNVEPDLLITPSTGKVFIPEGETYDWIYDQPTVKSMCCVLQEQVFINYDGKQGIAKAKGVDWVYEDETSLREHIIDGEFKLHKGDVALAVVGAGLAYEMQISHRFLSPIEIYFPSRTRKISLANPASAIEGIRVWPSGQFSVNTDVDKELIILPIAKMQELLEYQNEVSGVEIRLTDASDAKELKRLQKELSDRLGPEFKVKNRFEQNESLYKMMKYEILAKSGEIFEGCGFVDVQIFVRANNAYYVFSTKDNKEIIANKLSIQKVWIPLGNWFYVEEFKEADYAKFSQFVEAIKQFFDEFEFGDEYAEKFKFKINN